MLLSFTKHNSYKQRDESRSSSVCVCVCVCVTSSYKQRYEIRSSSMCVGGEGGGGTWLEESVGRNVGIEEA